MGGNLSSVPFGVFEPHDVEAMSVAHSEACDALHLNGDARARTAIAVRVIRLARRGKIDPDALRDQVLAEVSDDAGQHETTLRST